MKERDKVECGRDGHATQKRPRMLTGQDNGARITNKIMSPQREQSGMVHEQLQRTVRHLQYPWVVKSGINISVVAIIFCNELPVVATRLSKLVAMSLRLYCIFYTVKLR